MTKLSVIEVSAVATNNNGTDIVVQLLVSSVPCRAGGESRVKGENGERKKGRSLGMRL